MRKQQHPHKLVALQQGNAPICIRRRIDTRPDLALLID